MQKKGSLNLSIEAIIIIVLAMTLLGLGLGFIKKQMGSITDTSTSVQEQIKQQILDDLRTGNKKLSFPAQTISLSRGESKDIAIGVMNTKPAGELKYKVVVEVTSAQDTLPSGAIAKDQVGFFYDTNEYKLPVTEARVHGIKITAKGSPNTYLAKVQIQDTATSSVYDEKTFFVTIV